ncbi:hypothetical protein MKX01_037915 [Papaver californicum]|nr:hypothetical protein MKX01_037915 [Papaver californicum]
MKSFTEITSTHSYSFKRQRVGEHPAEFLHLSPEKKGLYTVSSAITLGDIQRDKLTEIASRNWSRTTTTGSKRPYNPDLVKEIYESELSVKQGHKTVNLQRVMILEVSRYLEYYLWTNFDSETSSFEHVMSMILMINEKGRTLSIAEKTNYLLFMINVFQSLENDIVSQTVLKLASLQMEMCLNPNLIKKWNTMIKKQSKVAEKREEPFDKLEVRFVKNLIEEFLESTCGSEQVNNGCVLYCKRFMEFLIDLLSQLPTRRFLRPVVADVAVVPKCHLSVLYNHPKGRLFAQLVDLLQFYEGFEINDHTGTQLSDDDVVLAHRFLIEAFQILAFEKVPKLKELALANVGSIHKRSDLTKKLSVLSPEELQDLVCNKLKLVSSKDPWAKRVDFLLEEMVSFFEKRQSQKESINALPLYPNEQIMWDESLVPSINYSGEGCLAFPKLNLQFLTLHDYLLRNFNLFRLESTYEIQEDIQEAVPHLLAYLNVEGETAFRGWIKEVKQPNIGEVKPASVTANEHDVLFLVSIRPSFEPLSSEEAAKLTVPERLGLQFVRGCEVIEIHDEEGGLMNDFTGRIKRDEWKPPKGELRTVSVALDTAQYFMDVNDIAEKGAEDVYGTFNMLSRRKPKENNFKAILESIRDLMNESCIVPDWLHNVFLGYGNPSAAQWTNMPDLLDTVDCKDMFLDADHLRRSFPDYQVCFTRPDGNEVSHLELPFRLKFPKALKSSTLALSGNTKSVTDAQNDMHMVDAGSKLETLIVEAYVLPDPGLTMVVGPPGTGKTDTAAQILNVLYHKCPSQRTLITACAQNQDKPTFIEERFPFGEYFSNTVQPVFSGQSFEKDLHATKGCFRHLQTIFQELEECRAFELLKSAADRANYLMTKQAKIVAMTCTHAAHKRKDFPSAIFEIKTFILMVLQRQEDGYARLKRCILIGDRHQLPPVVKNMTFQKYSHMDQSLFTRFVRLGIPYIELNAQGRARPNIAKLYYWRYRDLGNLPIVREQAIFHTANAGFGYDYQLVDVPDYNGRGEREAEYIVSVYIYMRLLGHPASKISILTTYNGQKLLIRDVISRRCSHPFIGLLNKVITVDKFQGQLSDFILLSLFRTRLAGHLRDVRRLIVAMSRARLGIYVFCRLSLFEQCYELQPTFQLLLQRPDQLGLTLDEMTSITERDVGDTGRASYVSGIEEMASIVDVKMHQAYEANQVNHS